MTDWPRVSLGDLAADEKSAISKPYGSAIVRDDYRDTGVPVVRGVNLARGRFYDDEFVFICEALADRMPGARLQPGDLVFTHRGSVGQVSMIPRAPRYHRYVLSTSQVKARLNPTIAIPEFFYYWFRSAAGQHSILQGTSTVGVPGLARPVETIKSLSVPLPSLEEQRRIAGVLGALADLIDTNRREADRLDALCRALGQAFFASNADGPVVRLDELADIVKGYSYRSSELVPGGGWLVGLKTVGRDGSYRREGLKPLTGRQRPLHIVENGDICVAHTDLTQNREVIGRPVRVRRGTAAGELVASLDLVIVRPHPPFSREYLHAVLDSPEFRTHALGFCNGTTVVHMASGAVPSFEAPVPRQDDLERFSQRIRTLRRAADQALIDAENLDRAQDEFLPLLLSGRLRVGDVAA